MSMDISLFPSEDQILAPAHKTDLAYGRCRAGIRFHRRSRVVGFFSCPRRAHGIAGESLAFMHF